MKHLRIKAFGGLTLLIAVMATCTFGPAGTFDYWQAWVFLSIFTLTVLAITAYLMKHDPKLLERRVTAGPSAEKQKAQKVIQALAQIAFILLLVTPALDHRLGWSRVQLPLIVAGNLLVVAGLFIVFLVFKENTFTSGIIEIAAGQKVISTGPYSRVRHPMYAGALIMILGIPLALGSWWGFLPIILMTAALIVRLIHEERFLTKSLPGYSEYKTEVKYRLIPGVW